MGITDNCLSKNVKFDEISMKPVNNIKKNDEVNNSNSNNNKENDVFNKNNFKIENQEIEYNSEKIPNDNFSNKIITLLLRFNN